MTTTILLGGHVVTAWHPLGLNLTPNTACEATITCSIAHKTSDFFDYMEAQSRGGLDYPIGRLVSVSEAHQFEILELKLPIEIGMPRSEPHRRAGNGDAAYLSLIDTDKMEMPVIFYDFATERLLTARDFSGLEDVYDAHVADDLLGLWVPCHLRDGQIVRVQEVSASGKSSIHVFVDFTASPSSRK